MISRYSRKSMSDVWSAHNRFAKMLLVEKAVASAQAELGLIPKEAANQIEEKGSFDLERILELEKTTAHDVIAFVSNVAENVGANGRYVHFGLTSSDVLDTALSLQIRDAGELLKKDIDGLLKTFDALILQYADTLCAGRTHGMHAEPTTFGLKMAGFRAELLRNEIRLQQGLNQLAIGKLSGAVGTYSMQTSEVEARVCRKLGLQAELFATQVIPRDRHAELFASLSLLAAGIERLCLEIRHLSRTEVGEVQEGFAVGQKGSSAMPHKKNPIAAENLCGCARLMRSYASAAVEDIALWHERDISHSSVERVIFPDAFILLDYMLDRARTLLQNLVIFPERMQRNIELSQGQLFSSHFLLALVETGLSREEAYRLVQELSHGLAPGEQLRDKALADHRVNGRLDRIQLDSIFSGNKHLDAIRELLRSRGPSDQRSEKGFEKNEKKRGN